MTINDWRRTFTIAFSACLCASLSTALANTIEVKQDGTGNATTIQAGINAAAPGDTVLVYPGTYFEHVLVNKELVVRSAAGSQVTTIDAVGPSGPAVVLSGPLTAASIFEGFGVCHGTNGGIDAAGILVEFCSPIVRDNAIYRNSGIGMSARGAGTPLFENNLVFNNSASAYLNWASQGTLRGNRFIQNAKYGIELYNAFPVEISDNLISRNLLGGISGTIPSGSALLEIRNNTIVRNGSGITFIYFADQVTLRRNIIAENRAFGVECGAPYDLLPTCVENDVWHNGAGDYVGPLHTPSDISDDPLFCAPTALNYALQSMSPCALGPGAWIGAFAPGC